MKILIIIANYYPKISSDLLSGANHELSINGIKRFEKIYVPGKRDHKLTGAKYKHRGHNAYISQK